MYCFMFSQEKQYNGIKYECYIILITVKINPFGFNRNCAIINGFNY